MLTSESNSNPTQPMPDLYPPPLAPYDQVAANGDLFMDTLEKFHSSIGTKFTAPTIGGKTLDLHRLFVEVTSRGGLEKVIQDRRWKEVILVFNFPPTITSASFVLRKYYLSLIYHYEQVYFFQKEGRPIPRISNAAVGATKKIQLQATQPRAPPEKATPINQVTASTQLLAGNSVRGTINGKFDNGYLVTVNVGTEQLKGVIYHVPAESSTAQTSMHVPRRRGRKKSKRALKDPFRPKSNRSGYNFFFAEHYARLKPLYYGQERVISKKIGHLWSKLTNAEKEVYQEQGVRDKERYRSEMLEYRKMSNASKS